MARSRKIVQNIVARLEAEDNASPELKKATTEGKNLAEASRKIIREFQRMDNHSAAVAKNIKSIRDSSLRAKVAMQTMRGTFTGTNSTLDKLEDKLTLVKIKLDNMGAAGTLVRKSLGPLKVAALAGAAAIAAMGAAAVKFAVDSVQLYISQSEEATRATEGLEAALEGLQIALVETTIGGDGLSTSINKLTILLSTLTRGVDVVVPKIKGMFAFLRENAPLLVLLDRVGLGVLTKSPIELLLGDTSSAAAELQIFQDVTARAEAERVKAEQGLKEADRLLKENARITAGAARGIKGGRGGKGKAKTKTVATEFTFDVDPEQISAIASARQEAAAFLAAENAARSEKIQLLGEQLTMAFQQANVNVTLAEQNARAIEFNNAMTESLKGLATNGIGLVTSALGDMITMLAAGEGSIAGLGAAILGQFGSMLKSVGEGMIGLGVAFSLIKKGKLVISPGEAIVAGAGLLATGAIMQGLSSRAMSALGGGSSSRGASAAAQDAVSTVVNNTQARQDTGPRENILVIGGHEYRAQQVGTIRQAYELGELPFLSPGQVSI